MLCIDTAHVRSMSETADSCHVIGRRHRANRPIDARDRRRDVGTRREVVGVDTCHGRHDKRISRLTTIGLVAPLLLAARIAFAAPAETSDPSADPNATLASRLHDLLGRPGGLTAADVAARSEATSFEVRAREEELLAAAAGVDQALVNYFPKLTLSARYTRLSPLESASFGNLVTAPNSQAGQDLPAGSRLVAFPLAFPVVLNQTILQASLNVPISDYVLRIPQAYAAATKSERSAALASRAAHLKAAADARVSYYTWVRARLQQVVVQAMAANYG